MLTRARAAATFAAIAAAVTATALARPASAGPVLLLEAGSGRVLYAEDADHKWFPASLTKIMTAYLAFEALKAGKLKLTDTVTVSEIAHKEPPSKLGLPVDGEITVDLAIRALIVKSANDVAVMLAEKIGGSVEGFAELMNAKAKRLGMTSTVFVNPNGLPAAGQITTARDLARLSRAVIADFPEYQAMWTQSEVQVGKLKLKSHNRLLQSFEGADGIKTGFICDSGFNVVASASRDGRRLLAVVLGEPSGRDRDLRAATLLEHGFATSDWKALLGAQTLDTMPTDKDAKPVTSVRTSVVAWNCNGKRPAARIAKRKVKPRATATAARATPAAAGDPATAAAAAAPAAAKAQPAARRAAPAKQAKE